MRTKQKTSYWKGKKFSEEHRKRMSEAHRGIGLGRKLSEEHKKKISVAAKARMTPEEKRKLSIALTGRRKSEETKQRLSIALMGNTNRLGNVCSEETKRKISQANKGRKRSKESRKRMSISARGKKLSDETKEKIRSWQIGRKHPWALSGEKSPNWRGGISLELYPLGWDKTFKEQIRQRDGYKCQICGVPEIECNGKLHVHHIDYNKANLNIGNLTSLCRSCHMKTNGNREFWIEYFNERILPWA